MLQVRDSVLIRALKLQESWMRTSILKIGSSMMCKLRPHTLTDSRPHSWEVGAKLPGL